MVRQGRRQGALPYAGDLYLVNIGKGVQRLTQDADVPEQDPSCSPDGKQIAYVKKGNLWVQNLDGGTPLQLTKDGGANDVTWGMAEFIAAEELARYRGYWWSPDGKALLALRVDESGVPLKTRARIFSDRTEMFQQRYPAAGTTNAKVTAWRIETGSSVEGEAKPLVLPRMPSTSATPAGSATARPGCSGCRAIRSA